MKKCRRFGLLIFAALLTMGLGVSAFGQSSEGNLANVVGGGSSVRFEVLAQNAGGSLTIAAPDGRTFTKEFRAGSSPDFTFSEKLGLPDGNYSYELRLKPVLTGAQRETLKSGRGKDDDSEADRGARKRPVMPNMTQSGAFAVLYGLVVVAGETEGQRAANSPAQPAGGQRVNTARNISGNTVDRLRNHRFSLVASSAMPDQVIPDDLIVQASLCVGFDCVNNEAFGFDTIRLKENNLRILFMDTSVGTFPSNDWQLVANDSASGGANRFSIEDVTGAKTPFTVTAGAATNSIFVDSTGRVGFRTSTPVLDLHVNTSNTPALRLEQNNTGGFTAQTWDIGANEANFFVRDVTGGSLLPFRIRPGAPTSSVDINASGNVGIGTASPTGKLEVRANTNKNVKIAEPSNGEFGIAGGVASLGAYLAFSRPSDGLFLNGIGLVNGGDTGLSARSNFHFYANGAEKVTILENGNVGIATDAPDQKLSVNGDADKVGGGSWLNFSDERLKQIKGNFKSGLRAVMQLNPIRYEYLKNNALGLKSDGEHIGFGAQALQKIIPEAVVKNSEGYLMVNNDPIIWTMLNAIKEQQKEIEQLKGQIRKLQTTSHRRRK